MKRQKQDPENGFGKWGGYMEAKISKLEEQFAENASNNNIYKKSDLFSGISIYVNGYTKPSADELKRIMIANGGVYHHYKRSHTKYIIASNLPDVKIRGNTENIIRADWVVDSLKQNKILDYTNYLIYTNQQTVQPKISFYDKNVKTFETNKTLNEARRITKDEKDQINQSDWCVIMKELEILNQKMQAVANKPTDTSNLNETIEIPVNIPSSSESGNIDLPCSDSPNMFESDSEHFEDYNFEKNKRTTPIIQISSESSVPESVIQLKVNDTETIDLIESSDSNIKNVKVNSNEKKESMTINCNVARTAVDPKFLSEFYNNSRLHHISTLGASFKQLINNLREKHSGEFPSRDKLTDCLEDENDQISSTSSSRIIMHIDIDCFFVSVGLRTRPHLIGHPVAVTHSKGSDAGTIMMPRPGVNRQTEIEICKKKLKDKFGVKDDEPQPEIQSFFETVDDDKYSSMSEIASCNYEARAKGLKNGMFVGTALKLCPNLKTISYDFASYKEVAEILYNTVAQYTLDIEAVSCDEMFVDLTELLQTTKINCLKFVSFLRNEIKVKTNCNCSVGIGENRLTARLATKKAKPNGQFYLQPADVEEFMRSILIKDLPGVGNTTAHRMLRFNWKSCGDLQKISIILLQKEFGKKFGENLYQFSRGIDSRPLVFGQIRKSVSAEINYGIRFTTNDEVEIFLKQLCSEVHNRLTEIKKRGKCITLKLMIRDKDAPIETSKFMGHGICVYNTKSISLPNYTSDLNLILKTVLTIMKSFSSTIPPNDLRGIGIQVTKLESINSAINKESNSLVAMFSKTTKIMESKKLNMDENKPEIKLENKEEISSKLLQNKFEQIPLKDDLKNTNQLNTVDKKINNKTCRGKGKKANSLSKTTKTITNMFQNIPKCNKKEEEYDDLDVNVLNELPIDIREEVLRDHRLKVLNAQKSPQKVKPNDQEEEVNNKIKVNAEFLDALPMELRREVEKEIAAQQNRFIIEKEHKNKEELIQLDSNSDNSLNETDNIFLKSDWKEILKSWLSSTNFPEDCDNEIICNYLNEFISTRRWDEIYIKLRYFQRIIEEQNICDWHKAYKYILSVVQNKMMKLFNKKLHIETNFKCC